MRQTCSGQTRALGRYVVAASRYSRCCALSLHGSSPNPRQNREHTACRLNAPRRTSFSHSSDRPIGTVACPTAVVGQKTKNVCNDCHINGAAARNKIRVPLVLRSKDDKAHKTHLVNADVKMDREGSGGGNAAGSRLKKVDSVEITPPEQTRSHNTKISKFESRNLTRS